MVTTSSSTPAAVREAGRVAGRPARAGSGSARRRDREVEPEQVGLGGAGEVLEPGDDPGRDAGEQDREQVGPRLGVGLRGSGTRPGRAPAAGRPARAWTRTARTALSSPRVEGVPPVLARHRDDDLVEQRVAEPGDLLPRTGPRSACRSSGPGPCSSAGWPTRTRRSPTSASMTSVGFLPSRVRSVLGTWIAMVCTFRPWSAVDARRGGRRDEVQVLERAQRAEVEDRAEVDEEAVGPLAGEDDPAAGQRVRRPER